jgi:hypothetical protein
MALSIGGVTDPEAAVVGTMRDSTFIPSPTVERAEDFRPGLPDDRPTDASFLPVRNRSARTPVRSPARECPVVARGSTQRPSEEEEP